MVYSDERIDIDDFELPPPAKFMSEVYGDKVIPLGAMHTFSLAAKQESNQYLLRCFNFCFCASTSNTH